MHIFKSEEVCVRYSSVLDMGIYICSEILVNKGFVSEITKVVCVLVLERERCTFYAYVTRKFRAAYRQTIPITCNYKERNGSDSTLVCKSSFIAQPSPQMSRKKVGYNQIFFNAQTFAHYGTGHLMVSMRCVMLYVSQNLLRP